MWRTRLSRIFGKKKSSKLPPQKKIPGRKAILFFIVSIQKKIVELILGCQMVEILSELAAL